VLSLGSKSIESRASGLMLRAPRSQGRQRLLPPEHVARLVRDHNDARATDFILCLGRPYLPPAYQAGAPGTPVSLVDTTGNGETSLRKPNM